MENLTNIIYQARFALKSNWLHAVQILEAGLKTNPEAIDLYIELAEIYDQKGIYKKSLQYYQKVLNHDPLHVYARFKSGNIYLTMDAPKLAIHHYNNIKENYPEALFNKAIAYNALRKNEEAIKTLKILVSLPEKMLQGYKYLIELLVVFDKTKDAHKYLNEAEETFGLTPAIHFLKAMVFAREKKYLKAYHEYLLASRDATEHPQVHHILASIAASIKQFPNAIKHLKDAIAINNINIVAVQDLINLLVKLKIVNTSVEFEEYFESFESATIDIARNYFINEIQKGANI